VITAVELSRALNALATTLGDQRPGDLDRGRAQRIVDGALAGERKLDVRVQAPGEGEVARSDDGVRVATITRQDGTWRVRRTDESRGEPG